MLEDRGCDLFPLGHLRQGYNSLQLIAKCLRVLVVGERGVRPRRSARREITGETIERDLDFRPGEVLDEQPRLLLMLRAAEERQTRTSGHPCSGPVDARHRR